MLSDIKGLLKKVKNGKITIDKAYKQLSCLPYDDIDIAKIDTHRMLRQCIGEVIYCKDKSLKQINSIVARTINNGYELFLTRVNKEVYEYLKKKYSDLIYEEQARIIYSKNRRKKKLSEKQVLVVTAGTSDISVAEEARVTLNIMGIKTEKLYDAGVAGVHRLLYNKKLLDNADVLIVIAGMEGALASVVGGLVDKPVIAVPTSCGYGASFYGLTALLGMLNSCAPGVVVVNIDNGFGAAYAAALMVK